MPTSMHCVHNMYVHVQISLNHCFKITKQTIKAYHLDTTQNNIHLHSPEKLRDFNNNILLTIFSSCKNIKIQQSEFGQTKTLQS